MKNCRTILLIVPTVMASLLAVADTLTPEEALMRALDGPKRVAGQLHSYILTRTVEVGSCPAAYLFELQDQSGFLVVSADDRCTALWGYGDSQITDDNGKPAPNFEYWLDWMAHRSGLCSSPRRSTQDLPRPERDPIEPLCKTQWSQEWPFNNKCPNLNGQLCVTGCGATSVAQVMKYHNWPPTGEGSTSYQWNGRTLSLDFSETSFDWENMLDSYLYGEPSNTQAAVALLMKAVGYGLHMNYNPYASGAKTTDLGPALVNHFRYDKRMRYVDRSWYSFYDWEELIYNSLRDYGPIVYNGESGAGGHSFVCDGYSRDGYFHINWGWRGTSDGYFLLDVLDPETQGTGGSGNNSGFNYNQSAIIDITPDVDGDSAPGYQMSWQGSLQLKSDKDVKNVSISSFCYNPGVNAIPEGTFGLSFTPVSKSNIPVGEPIFFGFGFGGVDPNEWLKAGEGFSNTAFDVSELPQGSYMVKPFFAVGGEEPLDMLHSCRYADSWLASVTEKRVILKAFNAIPIEFCEVSYGQSFSDIDPIDISALVINKTEYNASANVYAVILSEDGSEVIARTTIEEIEMPGNNYRDQTFSEVPTNCTELEAGKEYLVALAANNGVKGIFLLSEPEPMLFTGMAGVKEVATEPSNGISEYYNLQGVKVATVRSAAVPPNLTSGLYIIRNSNSKTTKIMLR